MEVTPFHPMSRASSPHSSALPSPPSSPGSSFSSLPSSAFSLSVPSSPPHHESPLPANSLIIPSLSLDATEQPASFASHPNADSLGHVRLLIVGAQGCGKTLLAETLMHGNGDLFSPGEWVDEPGLGRMLKTSKTDREGSTGMANVRVIEVAGFEQSDDPQTILAPIVDAVHSSFKGVLPLLSPTHPSNEVLRDLLSSPHSQFYTAALLLVSSPPTPLENTLLSTLSLHLPVLPIPSPIHRSRNRHGRGRPPSRTHHLRTMLFRKPTALRALRYEAADRFLRWREGEHAAREKHELWDDAARVREAPGKESCTYSYSIDPLHFPSVVIMSLSLLRPLAETLSGPLCVFGAFCAGVGVGWLLHAV